MEKSLLTRSRLHTRQVKTQNMAIFTYKKCLQETHATCFSSARLVFDDHKNETHLRWKVLRLQATREKAGQHSNSSTAFQGMSENQDQKDNNPSPHHTDIEMNGHETMNHQTYSYGFPPPPDASTSESMNHQHSWQAETSGASYFIPPGSAYYHSDQYSSVGDYFGHYGNRSMGESASHTKQLHRYPGMTPPHTYQYQTEIPGVSITASASKEGRNRDPEPFSRYSSVFCCDQPYDGSRHGDINCYHDNTYFQQNSFLAENFDTIYNMMDFRGSNPTSGNISSSPSWESSPKQSSNQESMQNFSTPAASVPPNYSLELSDLQVKRAALMPQRCVHVDFLAQKHPQPVQNPISSSNTNNPDDGWHRRFDKLREYKEEHGNCDVPQKWYERYRQKRHASVVFHSLHSTFNFLVSVYSISIIFVSTSHN